MHGAEFRSITLQDRTVYPGGILAHVHRSLETAGLRFGMPENPGVFRYAAALRSCARGFSSSPPAGPEWAIAAIKAIRYRDLDYDTAKKVMGYFQERGEAYPSEVEEDLELDYELVCQITEELKREGRLELL